MPVNPHSVNKKKFSCSDCDYSSNRKDHLKAHIEKNNKCGEDPQIMVEDLSVNDVITQQIAILPYSYFGGNIAITSISYFRKV